MSIVWGLSEREDPHYYIFLKLIADPFGGTMSRQCTITLEELIVSSLAQPDAVANLLIEKGVITQDEFMEKIKVGRAAYRAMFRKL